MTSPLPPAVQSHVPSLPSPFRDETFHLVRTGIHDDPTVSVYSNERGDFAFLHPVPRVDYDTYRPRHQALGLTGYRVSTKIMERRLEKVERWVRDAGTLLEIGSANGSFLRYLHDRFPRIALASQEPDRNARTETAGLDWLEEYASLEEIRKRGKSFDCVCFFHVMEHIEAPAEFLEAVRALLAPGGHLLVEVPSLDDPLLTVYDPPGFRDFYFQRQHPYYYNMDSLCRLLEHHGSTIADRIPHQRYGLENHVGWLKSGKPGGHPKTRELFGDFPSYVRRLEECGTTDAVIVVAT